MGYEYNIVAYQEEELEDKANLAKANANRMAMLSIFGGISCLLCGIVASSLLGLVVCATLSFIAAMISRSESITYKETVAELRSEAAKHRRLAKARVKFLLMEELD